MILVAQVGWSLVVGGVLDILKVTWPLVLAAGIAMGGAHHFYYSPRLENLELRLEQSVLEHDICKQTVKDQSESINNLSETSKEVSREFLEKLDNAIDRMTSENRKVIESILNAGVPEGCEESRQYLIRMIDQLQWNEEEAQ